MSASSNFFSLLSGFGVKVKSCIHFFLFFLRYLLNTSPSQLASSRALELQQEIFFKKNSTTPSSEHRDTPEVAIPAEEASIAPSLSARARPAARIAAAQAAAASAIRRSMSEKGLKHSPADQ